MVLGGVQTVLVLGLASQRAHVQDFVCGLRWRLLGPQFGAVEEQGLVFGGAEMEGFLGAYVKFFIS